MLDERITLALILITAVTSINAWQNESMRQKWMFRPFAINHLGQYYRFLSSGFIHSDFMHMLFNLIALYFFGGVLERIYLNQFGYFGGILYVITYLAGIVVSNIRTYFKYKELSHYNSLGASGGVASVLFAAIIYRPTSSICLYFALCLPAFIIGALYITYSYYSSRKTSDSINHDAHLFGSLFGIGFTILLRPAVVLEFYERIVNFNLYEFNIF